MRKNANKESAATMPRMARNLGLFGAAALMALACISSPANDHQEAPDDLRQTNLVSNLPGVALLQDTNLVNAWGVSFSATSPFWVSDNGSGNSTLYAVSYDTNGVVSVVKQGLTVTIPGEGNVTGQVFDGAGHFNGDIFLFASEDGTISGWRGALGTAAEVLTNQPNAIYKGLAMSSNAHGPLLLAANFHQGTVDAYDTSMNLVARFADRHTPRGYAPFNVQVIEGLVFVTFAKQDADKHDDVPGRGNGVIDVLNPNTGQFFRFATGKDAGGKLKEIDSPWGLALAPSTFGKHAGQLLVGNFGSGTIMAFEADGDFRGLLEGATEGPLVIDGLWGLAFGNGAKAGRPGTLYFTAGPNGEGDGLFGALDLLPEPPGHGHGHGHD